MTTPPTTATGSSSSPGARSAGGHAASTTATSAAAADPAKSTPSAGRRGRVKRPPRLAQLQLKRIDPWTVLKISLIVSFVMFFVWMIAVGVLYLSLGAKNVWENLNHLIQTLTTSETADQATALITSRGVFTFAAVVGAINIVLFTALSTIMAMVYNAAAGMAGGVEVTLGERDA